MKYLFIYMKMEVVMISKTLFIEQLKRFWAVSLVAFIIMAWTPFEIFISKRNPIDAALLIIRIFSLHNDIFLIIPLFILPIVTVFLTMSSFFNKNEMTYLYSFPIKKQAIHLTNALAGIILTVLPILFICLLLLIIPVEYVEYIEDLRYHVNDYLATALFQNNIAPGDIINTFPIVAIFFTRLTIIALFNFAVFWLAFSISGSGIISFLLAGALMLVAVLFPGYSNLIASFYFYGAPPEYAIFYIDTSVMIIPGVHWMFYFPQTKNELFTQILVYSLVIIFLSSLAFFISSLRKAENTGNAIVFNAVKNIIIFITSYSLGVIVSILLDIYYLGFLLGFVFGYFISQMIVEKSFFIWHRAKYLLHFTAVMVVLYAVFFLYTQFGMGFYINKIPEQVVGISITEGSSRNWNWISNYEIHFITSPDVISITKETHGNIIADRPKGRIRPWGQTGYNIISIDYLLENGRIMKRYYVLTYESIINSGLMDILTHEDMLLHSNAILLYPEEVMNIVIFHKTREFDKNGFLVSSGITDIYDIGKPEKDLILSIFKDYFIERERQRINNRYSENENEDIYRRDVQAEYFELYVNTTDAWYERQLSDDWNQPHSRTAWEISGEFFNELVEILDEFERDRQ